MTIFLMDNWKLLLTILLVVIFCICVWQEYEDSLITIFFLVGFVTLVVINIFSNVIDHSGRKFALVAKDDLVVIQKDPGTYWGFYQAYYFHTRFENDACRGGKRDTFGELVKDHPDCVRYVLIPEKLTNMRGKYFINNFSSDNDKSGENTRRLIEYYADLLAIKIIPTYPDFIKVIPVN